MLLRRRQGRPVHRGGERHLHVLRRLLPEPRVLLPDQQRRGRVTHDHLPPEVPSQLHVRVCARARVRRVNHSHMVANILQ